MIGDFALEIVVSPVGATISLPNAAPAGRLTWASRITTAQPVLYILDSTTAQEWGVGAYDPVAHTIIRPTVVLGNSAGTTAQLTQAAFGGSGSSCRCYGGVPSQVMIGQVWGGNAGRNLLHNSTFAIAQRTLPVTAANAYSVDRWISAAVNGTRSVSLVSLTNADRTAIGNDYATFALNYVFSGGSLAGDSEVLNQRGEFARIVGGKTVTVSFWAKAATGSPKVGINFGRWWGTGGSPQSDRVLTNGLSVTLNTTWTRYAVTFAIPAFTGTLGTTNTDYWSLELWLSSGSTNNTAAGSIGVQAATIQFWGAQMEFGSAPSPYERLDHSLELEECQRFYQIQQVNFLGNLTAGLSYGSPVFFSPQMRIAPAISAISSNNFGSGGFGSRGGQSGITNYGVAWGGVAASTVSGGGFIDVLGLSADF